MLPPPLVFVRVARSDIVSDGEPDWYVRVENADDAPIHEVYIELWYQGVLLGSTGPDESLRPCLAAYTMGHLDWPEELLRGGPATTGHEALSDPPPPGLVARLWFLDEGGTRWVLGSDDGQARTVNPGGTRGNSAPDV